MAEGGGIEGCSLLGWIGNITYILLKVSVRWSFGGKKVKLVYLENEPEKISREGEQGLKTADPKCGA